VRDVKKHSPGFLPALWDVQRNGRRAYLFWQRGGEFARNLWTPRLISKTIDDIHDNPERRGLCLQPNDWKRSSAGDCQNRRHGPLLFNHESILERIEFASRRGFESPTI